MKITKSQIKKFVEEYYAIENIYNNKNKNIAIHRGYFFYLCYKYSTDVINTKELADFIGLKQHGTVINMLNKIKHGLMYDKRVKLELSAIEHQFKKTFEVENFIIEVHTYSSLKLKRKLIDVKMDNIRKQQKIRNIERELKRIKSIEIN